MVKDTYIFYLAMMILLVVLQYVYTRYSTTLEEYTESDMISLFLNSEQVSAVSATAENREAYKNTTLLKKQEASQKLCAIKNMLENSVSISPITTPALMTVNKDAEYDIFTGSILSTGSGSMSIGGYFDSERGIASGTGVTDPNSCQPYDRWNPEVLTKKESIMGYLTALIKEYNTKILTLNSTKVIISDFIDDFKRMLLESIDDRLIPRCETCGTEDCTSRLCVNHASSDMSAKMLKSKELIVEKSLALETMLCDYVKQYHYIGDLQQAIIDNSNKMNELLRAANTISNVSLNMRLG